MAVDAEVGNTPKVKVNVLILVVVVFVEVVDVAVDGRETGVALEVDIVCIFVQARKLRG